MVLILVVVVLVGLYVVVKFFSVLWMMLGLIDSFVIVFFLYLGVWFFV